MPLINYDLHAIPVRLAARLLDPDAFVICSAMLKTHNTVVATLSVKNMALGAPLHQAPGRRAALERQAQVPQRRAPDALQHVPHRAGAGALLGRHVDRRL